MTDGYLIDRDFGERLAKVVKRDEQRADPTFAPQMRRLLGTPQVIGKAKVSSGTYPTLQAWSETAGGFTPKQRTWQFEIGALTEPGDNDEPRAPSTYWQGYTPAIYVTAYNLSQYHYVPENTYCALWQWEGAWYFDYTMPHTIYGTLDALLNSSTSALLTVGTFGGFGGSGGKCKVFCSLTIGANLLAGTQCYASLMRGTSDVRYEVTAVGSCPTVLPEEEE